MPGTSFLVIGSNGNAPRGSGGGEVCQCLCVQVCECVCVGVEREREMQGHRWAYHGLYPSIKKMTFSCLACLSCVCSKRSCVPVRHRDMSVSWSGLVFSLFFWVMVLYGCHVVSRSDKNEMMIPTHHSIKRTIVTKPSYRFVSSL